MFKSDNDARVIRRLSTSPYMLTVADSILDNIDRKALAELLASFLYFRSKGGNFGDFLTYALSARFRELAAIAASVAPALLAGFLQDDEFRSMMISSAESVIRGRAVRDQVTKTK